MPHMRAAELERVIKVGMRLRKSLGEVVRELAASILKAQARLRPSDVTRKGVGDFVTAIDLRSEKRLRRELRQLLPDAGFLGEETDPDLIDSDWLWIVDPIDGTSNFARGLPQFSVSVALLHRGQPILGVVHCQPEDALYVAVHRNGVWRNGRRVTTPRGRFDDGAMVGCQWFRGQADMSFLPALQSEGARIRTLGSTVVQLADCVMGRLDANVQQQGRLWDFAAAGLLAIEAGLRFTDWSGKPVFPVRDLHVVHTATVAARPNVHKRIVALLAPYAR